MSCLSCRVSWFHSIGHVFKSVSVFVSVFE